ncbi:PREDICTED: uncharacterized protein LOC105564934 [Vollenhovia emeryi]|uniref:uncharacterized protein LOC105564934 n=1 Tax=Vollenhovia emeryi TaxID=411798 RepID=UPI0005F44984|nr:PREDICTED: uncharacterized protein LOC105564934 [Vollenhovia emeryi]
MTIGEYQSIERERERSGEMKRFASPKHFSEAIALVTTVSCLLGLRVFEYPRGHPRPILSLIYLSFLYIIFCNGSVRVEEKYYANVKLMKLEYVLYQLVMYVMIVSVIMKMLLGWWHTKQFKVCHKKIFEVDATLRQLGLTVNYDRIYFVTIGTITIWITLAFMVCTVVFFHLQKRTDVFTSIYLILVYTYSLTVNSINVFEFFIFARCLQIKFELVNQFLRQSLTNLSMEEVKVGIFEMKDYAEIMDAEQRKKILSTKMIFRWRQRTQSRMNVPIPWKRGPVASHNQTESHSPFQFEKEFQRVLRNRPQGRNTAMTIRQERKHLLQIIKQVHLELCKVSQIVCTILGVQIAWEIGVIILFLIEAIYNLYVRYIMNQHKVKGLVGQTFVMVMLCLLNILKAVFLNRACSNATIEGNRTIEIIHAIYGCDADIDMQEEIQQFGIQILQRPVTFSAFGLILDNRVLSMILRIVSIYIVIMVQVSNTLESNNAIQYTHF